MASELQQYVNQQKSGGSISSFFSGGGFYHEFVFPKFEKFFLTHTIADKAAEWFSTTSNMLGSSVKETIKGIYKSIALEIISEAKQIIVATPEPEPDPTCLSRFLFLFSINHSVAGLLHGLNLNYLTSARHRFIHEKCFLIIFDSVLVFSYCFCSLPGSVFYQQ